jgi:cobalt/nickel transport system permease protein
VLSPHTHAGRDSIVHHIDARAKLVIALCFTIAAATAPRNAYAEFAAFACLPFVVGLVAGVPPGFILKRALLIIPFTAAVAFFVPFMKGGTTLFELDIGFKIAVPREGAVLVFCIFMKSFIAIATMTVLSATTSAVDLIKGLENLKCPRMVTTVLFLMHRYVVLLVDEGGRLLTARRSRTIRMNPRERLKSLGQVASVLLFRSFERGERVYESMCSRGFDGSFSTLRAPRLTAADVAVTIIAVLGAIAIRLLGATYV